MRLPVLFVLIVCLCASVQAQTFPYRATICEPEAFVRSGPGRDFYPTDKLRNGDTVEVYKHTVDGWCAIRPPLGSFSYVPARNIQMTQNDLGRIVGNSVPVYIGSRLSPERSQVRITLTAGKMVEVLELPTEGLDAMVKISPPAGEFRWIHGKSLSPNLTGVTEEPTPPDRTLPGTNPVPNTPALTSEDLGGVNSIAEASIKPGTFTYYVNQLDADLSYIISNSDSAHWETEGLLMRANRLMNYAKTTQEKERLEHVRQKIIEADGVRQNRQQFQKLLSTASEDGITPLASGTDRAGKPYVNYAGVSEFPAPFSTEPGRWDYSGILVKVQRQRYAHLSLPPYAIVNEDGILRCYVTPAPNMDLSPYVKKRVSLAGSRNYMRDQRAFNLNVKVIVNVW